MIFLIFLLFIDLICCLECSLDQNIIPLNISYENVFSFSIINKDVNKAYAYIHENKYLHPDKVLLTLVQNIQASFTITVRDRNNIIDGEKISILCYNSIDPNEYRILNITVLNNYYLCSKDDLDIIDGECNDESYMTISYKYRNSTSCFNSQLPQNETIQCCIYIYR